MKIQFPDDVHEISHGGVTFKTDEKRMIELPHAVGKVFVDSHGAVEVKDASTASVAASAPIASENDSVETSPPSE